MIGMLMVTLATVPTSVRFGVDSIASSIPQFGTRGWVIPSGIQYFSIVGWNSQLLIFFSKSMTQLLVALHLTSVAAQTHLVSATILLACALVFVFLLKGSGGVDRVAKIVVAHVFIGLWMLYILMSHRWNELSHAVPPAAAPERLWNYVTGVEIGISSLLSWWPYIGSMVRMAPMAPLCGIQIIDYYVLRNRKIDIRAIYTGPRYRFWSGINPAAVVAMLVGFGVYTYLLNPLTYVSRWPYQYLTASLRTALAAALVYWLITRLGVIPARRGGYGH